MNSRLAAQRGYSLLELSMVLVVIGLVIGATTIGSSVYQSAVSHRVVSDFIQGWITAYNGYHVSVGRVPGDDPANRNGRVNHAKYAPLCDGGLRQTMQAQGIAMPMGRHAGAESRYVYTDRNGLPQELEVCFQNADWSEPGATLNSYVVRERNVMVLSGVTPSLATTLDHYFDNHVDARFGKVREASQAARLTTNGAPWSLDEAGADEGQSGNLTVWIQMLY